MSTIKPLGPLGPYEDGAWYPASRWADDLGIAEQTIHNRRAAKAPGPRATKIHGRLGYLGADLNEWLRSQRETERAS